MTYQIKKYQSFEKIKNRWGGFVKLYSGIYTHHCIHNAAKKNQSKRVELFKYFLSETAFSTREIKVKNKNFTLHKHYALINASAIKKKLDINRGIIVAFLNDLERDDTISITSIKGIGYLIKFNNFEKFQKKDAQIKVDTTIYRTFLDYDVINLMHKMNLKQSQNKLSYNKEELKELKELKESKVSNKHSYNINLKTLSFLENFYNSLSKNLKIKIEPFAKISKEKKQEVNNLIEKLEELGFTEKKLKDYEKNILDLFTMPKFKGSFVNFYLFLIKIVEWFNIFSADLLEKEALIKEEEQVNNAIKEKFKCATQEQEKLTRDFYKALQKTMSKETFDKVFKDKIIITPVRISTDCIKVKIIYANGSTFVSSHYHFPIHIRKAFDMLKMRDMGELIFTKDDTAIITNYKNN